MKMLAVIDIQNDFIDGSLGTAEAVSIVENVKNKIISEREKGTYIVFTRDTHGEDYLSTREGKKLPVKHCIKGTKGWEITEKIETSGSKIIDKPTFGTYELAEYAASLEGLEEIEVVGLCTDICVISNALLLKAKLPEINIIVDPSCCAGVTPESHENAVNAMAMCQIEIKNSQKL